MSKVVTQMREEMQAMEGEREKMVKVMQERKRE